MTDSAVLTQVGLLNEMVKFCDNGPVDKKAFRSMTAMYVDLYKRLSYAQQGEVSHILLQATREAATHA